MPASATVSVASPAGRRGRKAAAEPAPAPTQKARTLPALAAAAGVAALAVAAGVACRGNDACLARFGGLFAGSSGGYAPPAAPKSRFGSPDEAPQPGTPEAEALSAKAAKEAAAAKPPPPSDGPIQGMWVDGGANAPRDPDMPAWPARVRVERSKLHPRKAGALEAAIQELEAEGVAVLVDEGEDTPWDLLLPSRVGGMERLRLNATRPGQAVATLPEPLTHRRNYALLAQGAATGSRAAAKRVWGATPPVFVFPQDRKAWMDAGNADPSAKWILKSGSRGHPVNGHDWGDLATMAAASMLPVTQYELAQKVVAPPAAPGVLGERGTLRLFVLVTSLRPLRAYVAMGAGVVVVRDPAALAAEAVRARARPTFQQWVAPWADVAPLLAAAGGPSKPARMLASAKEAIATTLAWASLEAPVGDPHGDLQFSPTLDATLNPAARGKAWDLLVANVAFDRRYRARVVDWEPGLPARLAADHAVFLSPGVARGGADGAVKAALKGAVEVALRRRERWLAADAGVCAPGRGDEAASPSLLPPAAWRAGGDPCGGGGEDEDAWEARVAARAGYEAVTGPAAAASEGGKRKRR